MARTSFRLEAIRPGDGRARSVYQKRIRHILDIVSRQVERDFKDTVKTWDGEKPVFYIRVTTVRGRLGITAGTDNVIYGYVNYGTRPHIIRPKKSQVLSFQWGGPGSYQAKTKPGRIVSRPGGQVGSSVQFKQVNHPGFPGRHFDTLIAQRRQRSVQSLLEREVALATREVNDNRRKGQR